MSFNGLIAKGKERPTASVCAVLSVLLLLAVFVRAGALNDARESLDRISREGNRINDNIKNSLNIGEHLDAVQAVAQDVDARLVRPAELARNLQYFYRLEGQTGVRIASLDQRSVAARGEDEEGAGVYVRVPYEMAVEGEFTDLLTFVHAIENGRHFARIRNFEIIRARQTESTLLSMAMNLELLGQR